MKKIFFFIVFYFFFSSFPSPFGGGREGVIFAQPQTCPRIFFNYDESGNRTLRDLTAVPCRLWNNSTQAAPADSTGSLQVRMYPNPAKDKIIIELEKDELEPQSKIFLYDVNGKEIYTETTASLRTQIDFSRLSGGTYMIKITRGKKISAYNVMKN